MSREQAPPAKTLTTRQAAFIGVGSMVGAGIFALLGAAGAVAGAFSCSPSGSTGGGSASATAAARPGSGQVHAGTGS